MNSPLYKYILFILFFIALGVNAQTDGQETEDAYEPDSLFAVRNAVKFDPVQIIFGDFRFYYERILTEHLSFEAGLGPTRRNYTASWFDPELDNLGENIDIRTGVSASLSFRYYFQASEELYGPYLSLGVNYRNHLKDINVLDSLGSLTGREFTDERQTTSIILKGGFQALPISSNIFADFFTGPALRIKNYEIVRTTSLYDADAYSISELNELTFGWEVGVRIGFGF